MVVIRRFVDCSSYNMCWMNLWAWQVILNENIKNREHIYENCIILFGGRVI